MAFNDKMFKDVLQKAIIIGKWAVLRKYYNEIIQPQRVFLHQEVLNFYDILDQLKFDGQDSYAKELEQTRDKLIDQPTSDTAFGLFKKLRRITEDGTDDSKKLLLYADSIEYLIKDDTEWYEQVWEEEFIKIIDIVVGKVGDCTLFNELLDRIRVKNPTAATQLSNNYKQLQELSNNGKNAREKELEAITKASCKLASLMREIARKIENPASGGKAGEIKTSADKTVTEIAALTGKSASRITQLCNDGLIVNKGKGLKRRINEASALKYFADVQRKKRERKVKNLGQAAMADAKDEERDNKRMNGSLANR